MDILNKANEIHESVIEQAERVHELESESYNAHLERLLDEKEKQNQRYREALENALEEGMLSESASEMMRKVLEESK